MNKPLMFSFVFAAVAMVVTELVLIISAAQFLYEPQAVIAFNIMVSGLCLLVQRHIVRECRARLNQ